MPRTLCFHVIINIILYFHTKTYTSKSESNLQNKAYLQHFFQFFIYSINLILNGGMRVENGGVISKKE